MAVRTTKTEKDAAGNTLCVVTTRDDVNPAPTQAPEASEFDQLLVELVKSGVVTQSWVDALKAKRGLRV